MSVYDQALEFRSRVLARERDASTRVLQAYGNAWRDIQRSVSELLSAIGDTKPTQGELARLAQYQQLLATLDQAVAKAAAVAGGVIEREQYNALLAGSQNAQTLISAMLPDKWATFVQPAPLDQLTAMLGLTADGTPLDALLQQSGSGVAPAMLSELQRAIVAGLSPSETARRLQALWGQPTARALTVARTEMLRAYRESSRNQYQANSDVVKGWQWLCARSKRTCPACLALDGQTFDLSEPQPAHVNCRCTMIPVLHNRDTPKRQTGAEWLAAQSEEDQRSILGDKGYAAYSNGADLSDFVSYRHDHAWGKQALWKVPEQ